MWVNNENDLAELVQTLGKKQMPFWVEVVGKRKGKTLAQLALYWKWVEIFCHECGYDSKENVSEGLKSVFVDPDYHVCPITGEVKEKRKSIADMSTNEMSEYMDKVYRFIVIEQGVTLPLPEEQHLNCE